MSHAAAGDGGGLVLLHIGLPKTGTTHLQQFIFERTPEIRFLHRNRGSRMICRSLRRLAGSPEPVSSLMRWYSSRTLRALAAEGKPVLLSHENVAMAAHGIWTGRGPDPETVAARLAALAAALAPVRLKLLLGIRGQDRWLASRYAESSRDFPDFGQADFDARMAGLAARAELGPVEAWLDHDRAHAALSAAVGHDNVFLLPTERLREDALYGELGRFAGGVDFLRWHRRAAKRGATKPRNALSGGADSWRLRRDDSPLGLSPELAGALRTRFAASNRRLADRAPVGLGKVVAAGLLQPEAASASRS